ncbi:MAG TPA: response regulator [Polyangiaceae bacterium]|nr:response regulator [Polyangiaceae bacterium]
MQANILLVEDEPVARGALSELLTSSGYRVRVAADGAAALAELRSFSADLVLTNLQLPNTDGLELLRGLNRRPAPPAVVMMIALGANELAVAAMREGALAYLSKPVNSDELLLVLERCLERVRLAREAEALKDQLEELRRFDNAFGSAPAVPFATMLDFERYIILKTLAATGGSVAKAAAALGISVRKIQYRLRDYRKVGEVERSQTGPDRGASSCAPSLQSRE